MKNIVETAVAAGKFNTLIAAVKAAKLEGIIHHLITSMLSSFYYLLAIVMSFIVTNALS
jgi:hypothetical protein